ncbi:MAG TPA: nitrous oxide reductase accessory protein NosL [Nitrospirota bacterium]|nr:nitrous oxide reductase accessory protein NosL [Nitrospirota bacterium]
MKLKHVASILFIISLFSCDIIGPPTVPQPDIDAYRKCAYCGMDRKAHGYSRMLILYEDGTGAGVCSLYCALIEIDAHQGRKVKALLVADRYTRILVEAEKATWVLGGRKSGVMSKRAKWAFQSNESAERFVATYGGKIVSWGEALAAAREDLAKDTTKRR